MTPLPNGQNGRRDDGKFAPGWKGGPGNPHGKRTARLRAELLRCVRPADIREIVSTLLAQAKSGDLSAIRELLNRTLGTPIASDIIERIERLEESLNKEQS